MSSSKQRGSRVNDQKQEVKEEQMSKEATLVLMKNLTKDYAGMGLKVLDVTIDSGGVVMTNNVEAFRLQNWLERGVFPAVELEFVDSVKFGIFTRHPKTGKDLNIESYEFRLQYADGHKKAEVNGIELSKQSIRTQAQRFLRSLIEFSKTLDDIPETRWLTIALKYNKTAPRDYEPEQFEGTSATVFNMAMDNPLRFDFKEVVTPHINLNVSFEGRESLKPEDLSAVGLSVLKGGERLLARGADSTGYFSATSFANEVCTDTAVETFADPYCAPLPEEGALSAQSQEEEMQLSQKKSLPGVSFADPICRDDDSLVNTQSQQSPSGPSDAVMAQIRDRIESFLRCSAKGETKSECSKHLDQFKLVGGFRDRLNAVGRCLERLVADGLVKKNSSQRYLMCENLRLAGARKQQFGLPGGNKKRGGADPALLLPLVARRLQGPPAPPNSIEPGVNAENWNPNISQLTDSRGDSDSSSFKHEPPKKRRAIISEPIGLQRGVNDFPSSIAHSQVP